MTTRSGREYKGAGKMSNEGERNVTLEQMLQALLEDRQRREEELREERERQDREVPRTEERNTPAVRHQPRNLPTEVPPCEAAARRDPP